MRKVTPYTVVETLYEGGGATLLRALRPDDGRPVILKVLAPHRSRPGDRRQLEHEYEMGKLVGSPAVVRPIALETCDGLPTLVMEDFGGRSLDHLLGAPMAVKTSTRSCTTASSRAPMPSSATTRRSTSTSG